VDNKFNISFRIIFVLSFGPKLQLNLKNMDIGCEVRT
jgi:hypothetical protein